MVTLDMFDSLIAEKSLLKHPFYVKWSKGELTQEDLKIYAKEYFHLVSRIPVMVQSLLERAKIQCPVMVPQIAKNMREEQEHVELWKRFALSLGVSDAELAAHQPSAMVRDAVSQLEAVCAGTFEEGAAAIYALERELPEIAETKKAGLAKFYGLTSVDAHIYFDEHLNEAEHLKVWLKVRVPQVEAQKATARSLMAQNQVLDAVCHVAGIDVMC